MFQKEASPSVSIVLTRLRTRVRETTSCSTSETCGAPAIQAARAGLAWLGRVEAQRVAVRAVVLSSLAGANIPIESKARRREDNQPSRATRSSLGLHLPLGEMGLHWIALLALAQLATASPVHSSSLVVAPLAEAPACATYHGPVGSLALLYLPPSCSAPSGTHGTPFDWSAGRLVWVTESVLDKEVNELRERKAELARTVEGGAQLRFGVEEETRMVLDLGKAGQLVQFPSDEALLSWTSDAAHALTELVAISSLPLPLLKALRTSSTGSSTVDQRSIKRIVDHLAALRFSPLISTLLATFPRKQFKKDVQWLSGEQQGGEEREKWVSRHSMSEGGAKASDWILGAFRSLRGRRS